MKRIIWITVLAAAFMFGNTADAQLCEAPLTAAAAGTNSTATGTFMSEFDAEQASPPTQTGFILTVTFQGVTATAVRVRLGDPGDTGGQIITNMGGQTTSPVVYNVTATELQNLGNNPWYVVVESAAFPNGEIRMNSTDCDSGNDGEEGELNVPEGFQDYECIVNMNGAQVVPAGSGTAGTGTITITPLDETRARILMLQTLPDTEAEATLRAGGPDENGPLIRNLGNVVPGGVLTVTYGELEDYTNGEFYIEIIGNQGGRIRGNIIGCEFDDGVPEGEGEAEFAEGEGEEGCTPGFPEGEPENLLCEQEMTSSEVVPPSSSIYQASYRLLSQEDPEEFGLVVRHTIPDPAQIAVFRGAPGANGTPFRVYDANLFNMICNFGVIETVQFFEIIQSEPHYIQITSESDPTATLRADITCILDIDGEDPVEGEGEGGTEGEGEGEGDGALEGEGEGELTEEQERLRILADNLLFLFPLTDLDDDNLMSFNEVSASLPSLQQVDFDLFDSDDNGELTPGELHRYAGPVRIHNMDYNGDKQFTLTELLRVVQFYNSPGGYGCIEIPGSNEDGFEPLAAKGAEVPTCKRHASDYENNGNFEISLTELLRAIQFFNFSGGNYGYASECGGLVTEDGFCPSAS